MTWSLMLSCAAFGGTVALFAINRKLRQLNDDLCTSLEDATAQMIVLGQNLDQARSFIVLILRENRAYHDAALREKGVAQRQNEVGTYEFSPN